MAIGTGGVARGAMNSQSMGVAPTMGGTIAGAAGGVAEADRTATDPKFGDILGKIQNQMGAKPQKPREIKKTLGKDDFMRIMVTQMKHQDPTAPFKAEQMAAQMAQFASVEQLQNINNGLTKMQSQNQPLERLAMTNMIGKTVTVDRDRFAHTEGQTDSLSFTLPREAKELKLVVVSEGGEVILEKDLGSHKAGEGSFGWDGLKANTIPAKTGNYILRIEAKDEKGSSIATNGQRRSRVIGVSFEGSEPVFLVGDNKQQDKVLLKHVVRIESEGATLSSAPNPGAPGLPENPGANIISFQRGVGSAPLESGTSSPEASSAMAAPERGRVAQGVQKNSDNEMGFPNGLREVEEVAVVKGGDTK
ncbi:flagellar hook assembly protein FlgD [Bdellovibrionota bacterium FG-2]